jgi:hypothetical protein
MGRRPRSKLGGLTDQARNFWAVHHLLDGDPQPQFPIIGDTETVTETNIVHAGPFAIRRNDDGPWRVIRDAVVARHRARRTDPAPGFVLTLGTAGADGRRLGDRLVHHLRLIG